MGNLHNVVDELRYATEELARDNQIASCKARLRAIRARKIELEEAGELCYFGTGCQKPEAYSLTCEAQRIRARLMQLGLGAVEVFE